MSTELIYKDEVYAIQGAVFEVYKSLGNGYAEEVYDLKAVDAVTPEHMAQLDNYLFLTNCRLGLLVNFGSYPRATVTRWLHHDKRKMFE